MDKKLRLPKDQFIDGQDVEGHRVPGDRADDVPGPVDAAPPADATKVRLDGLEDEDVEGHGAPSADDFTILPSPPSIGLRRTPGHGGE